MKIAASNISMSSAHSLETRVEEKKTIMEKSADGGAARVQNTQSAAAVYESSAATVINGVEIRLDGGGQMAPVNQKQTPGAALQSMGTIGGGDIVVQMQSALDEMREDMQTSLLHRMLELLNGKSRMDPVKRGELTHGKVLDIRSSSFQAVDIRSRLFSVGKNLGSLQGMTVGTTSAGTLWQRVTSVSTERTENEYTSFQSKGLAVTEDGRTIDFDVSFSMARSFSSKYESLTREEFIMTDPLIINLDNSAPSVSDVKFRFDLDSDGRKEEISFAGKGSGFLALDSNNNGVIDDGSELFGTKSGNGFADLAAYDQDGNHWIDENDAVYDKLRVWTKDEQGQDRLMSLKEANVGAIYLGSVSTEFTLKDAANETNAVVRRSGVYLKETGEAGTLSHVDLKC